MAEAVADASAVLACVADEPGSRCLLEYDLLHVCAVNHAEIITNMIRWGYDEAAMDAALRKAPARADRRPGVGRACARRGCAAYPLT